MTDGNPVQGSRSPYQYAEMMNELRIGLNAARDCLTSAIATIAMHDGTGFWGDTEIRDEVYRIRDDIMALAKRIEEKERNL